MFIGVYCTDNEVEETAEALLITSWSDAATSEFPAQRPCYQGKKKHVKYWITEHVKYWITDVISNSD